MCRAQGVACFELVVGCFGHSVVLVWSPGYLKNRVM